MADNEVMERTQEARRRIRPLYKITEKKGEVYITMEMPGVQKNDLSVSIENRELRVIGNRPDNAEQGNYLVRERRDGDFSHAFTIDDTIDQNSIDATLENGVLTIALQQKEEVKPKRIQIKTS